MEATLRDGRDVISREQWSREVTHSLSHAYAPFNPVSISPHRHALSDAIQACVASLLDWASGCISAPLAREALLRARSCSRFIVYWCTAPDVPCCFSGVVPPAPERRLQVCFCDANYDGSISRSLFYAFDCRYLTLLNCFYLLGHMSGFAVDLSTEWKALHDNECDHGHGGDTSASIEQFMEPLRQQLNACMGVVYHTVLTIQQLRDQRPPTAAVREATQSRSQTRRSVIRATPPAASASARDRTHAPP
jgi:hypothetical protein